jgi:hypothetical protein
VPPTSQYSMRGRAVLEQTRRSAVWLLVRRASNASRAVVRPPSQFSWSKCSCTGKLYWFVEAVLVQIRRPVGWRFADPRRQLLYYPLQPLGWQQVSQHAGMYKRALGQDQRTLSAAGQPCACMEHQMQEQDAVGCTARTFEMLDAGLVQGATPRSVGLRGGT